MQDSTRRPEPTERLGLADFLEMFVRVLRADANQHHYGPDPWKRAPEHALALDYERAEFLLDEADRADAALADVCEGRPLLGGG